MDRLSSCYFCGGALDASLAEYPVVPTDLQSPGSDSPTVVLCSTCRRKLGAVIEEVVAATTDERASTDAPSSATAGPEAVDSGGGPEPAAESPGETSDLRTPSEGEPAPAEGEPTDPAETADLRTPSEGDASGDVQAATDLGGETAGQADGPDDGPHLTKLEYNKVMRLLQNRPFPVDRAEIREVATSAYDLDPREFDAVVDAAVDRGLIAERDGQFVEPN